MKRMMSLVIAMIFGLAGISAAFAQPSDKGARGKSEKAKKKGEAEDDGDEERGAKQKGKKKAAEAKGKGEEKAAEGKAKGEEKAADPAAKPVPNDQVEKELQKHASRKAKIERLEKLGEEKDNDKLVEKANMLRDKEATRHERKMKELHGDSAAEKGGDGEGKAKKGKGEPDQGEDHEKAERDDEDE